MRPLRSFLLLLIFLACFTGLHYIIHPDKLFPSLEEFIPADILNSLHARSQSKTEEVKLRNDSVRITPAEKVEPTCQLPELSKETSANPLKGFLDSLNISKHQVRIMYYGDSQIEGDRITSFMRHELRKGHDGTGPGLFLPLMPVMYTKSLWLKASSNWKKYNYLSYKAGEISHKNLGPFMAVCRYLPEGEIASDPEKASIRIRPSIYADSATAVFDRLRVFYGNNTGTVRISVITDGNEIASDTLVRGSGYNEFNCALSRGRDISVDFEGKVSPDIYGISIESESGLIVDNIPQRGSAGLEFTMVGKENLLEAYRKISPDLIILHYGLNIVRNITGNYSYYEKGLIRQISLLKLITPDVPVLVIGVTDMASNEGDSVRSYRNIPAIIEAQRVATERTRENFWNSYTAMGGRSSIIRWSEKKPPLAQKDYVHFTYPGADTISGLLLSSLFVAHSADNHPDSLQKVTQVKIPEAPVIMIESPPVVRSGPLQSLMHSLSNYEPGNPFIFTSAAFWVFFLFVLLGYSFVYKKLILRNIYLFLISLFFYYKAGGLFLFILIFVTLADFTFGLLIFNAKTKGAKKFFVLLSVISNLGLLGYFKYSSFIVNTINQLSGSHFRVYDFLSNLSNSFLGTSFDISYIILPVGISFFTFQSLSYTIDIYRAKMKPVRNIIDFGFYVSFFPHLVAGPIVRASVFIPQIYQEFRLSRPEFSHALYMISKGLIKKIIISNFIALNLVDRVFDAPAIYSGFENLLAIYGYGLQIYCDFSGYTDIAIGVALILGFRLPLNFNAPYKAKSITDFWQRWHISLSQWLRDYLYISLGGNRKGKIRTYFNLMITMLLGGLWHGASLRYVIWGGLHGIGLVINKMWNSVFRKHGYNWIGRAVGIFLTFQFVNFCWIFFRAPDLESVKIMFKQIFESFSPGSYMTVLPAYSNALLLMAVAYTIHFLPETVKDSYRGVFIKIPLVAQLAVIMAVAILLFQMRTTGVMPFIYFRF